MKPQRWWLLLILLIAAALRFQNLNAIEHNVDHAYPIWQAMMTLDHGYFPVTGQGTSVLFANPALMGYLLIPWVALTRSPIGPYVFILILNTMAVWFAYEAAALLLDENRALIAAFLMAVNPWVIEYSRTTWVQALLPFFTCLVAWLLIPVLLKRSRKPGQRTIFAFIALTLMTQTYLLAFAILIPVGLLLVIFYKRLVWRSIFAGAAIFLVATGIYAAGLYANRADTLARLQNFTSGDPAHIDPTAWSHAVRLISGANYAVSRGLTAPIEDWELRENLSLIVHDVILVALLGGIGAAIYAIWRRRQSDRAIIALVWFGMPILLMTYTSKPVHPFYLLLTLPAGYILAAWGMGWLLRWRIGTVALLLAAVPITILMSLNVVRFAQNTLAKPGAHGLSAMPVGVGIDMARHLLSSDARGAVVVSDVDDWILNSFAGQVFPVNRDIDTKRITYVPAGNATYLLFKSDPSLEITPPIGAGVPESYTMPDGTDVVRYQVLRSSVPFNQPIRSDKGISFLGWKAEQPLTPGSTASILTYWRIDDLLPERGQWLLSPFIHAYQASGKQIANRDTAGVAGALWQLNDIYIERIFIPVPADATAPFTLQIGQYDGVHNLNALFTLPDGSINATIPIQP